MYINIIIYSVIGYKNTHIFVTVAFSPYGHDCAFQYWIFEIKNSTESAEKCAHFDCIFILIFIRVGRVRETKT